MGHCYIVVFSGIKLLNFHDILFHIYVACDISAGVLKSCQSSLDYEALIKYLST